MTPRAAAPSIDILVQSPLWNEQPAAEQTVRDAIAAAAASLPDAQRKPNGEVSVVLTDDATIRALNKEWRKIDKATNVLSFPAGSNKDVILGDVVIAYETLQRECAEEDRVFLHHLAHISVHGFLHLMGYDHETDAEADSMERLETAVLQRLGLPDPYLGRELRD
ncbi:MAG: rRNA maturation RNase YbeY [Pseudolabrys sp.]|nr:rRNA maturation RNase YbeY [Pseudolabrys sp.]